MMKEWLGKIVFILFLLLLLLPSHYEVAYVSDQYHRHPWLLGLLVAVLLGGFGWWLRRQTEVKTKAPL
jgi:nitrate reductase gamma subunit